MDFFHLHTERLLLRKVTPGLYGELMKLSNPEIMEFFGYSDEEELRSEKYRFEHGLRMHNKSFLYFQLIEKKSNLIIGWCGYHTWYLDHHRAEIGYGLISDRFKRKGFMTEAISPILQYGFSEMKLHRIEAFASPENIPSIKLLKAHHFEKEGLLREHYLKDGHYEDSEVYGLISTNS